MLIDVPALIYRKYFITDPHPYLLDPFIELNKHKVDKVVRLIEDNEKASIGLIAGIVDNTLRSPFSAPFGGFHFDSNELMTGKISNFIAHLKDYLSQQKLQKFEIILPPDIYHHSINAKFINAFIRNGFTMVTPEIANWINLNLFDGTWVRKRVNESIKFAQKNKLTFIIVSDLKMMSEAYDIIVKNREHFGRKIYMAFEEILEVSKIFPVDFFLAQDQNGENIGSAIFYRGHRKIVQAIFWGDTLANRSLGTMDFLVSNLFHFYKKLGFDYIDLGISSEQGTPNEGLVRFKETHNCISSLRFAFSLQI